MCCAIIIFFIKCYQHVIQEIKDKTNAPHMSLNIIQFCFNVSAGLMRWISSQSRMRQSSVS